MPTPRHDASLFDDVEPPHSLFGVAIFCVAAVAGMVAGALIGQKVVAPQVTKRLPPPPTDGDPVALALRQGVYLVAGFAPVVGVVAVAVGVRERRGVVSLGLRDENVGRNLLRGAAVGASLVLLPTLAAVAQRTVRLRLADRDAPRTQIASASTVLVALAFQSFAEELIFRGWLLPTLAPRTGRRAALLLSSVAFAASHLLNGNVTPVAVLNLTLAGYVLGTLTLQTRTIWAATAAHALWNYMEIAGIPFAETVPKTGAILLAVRQTEDAENPTEGWLFAGGAATLLLLLDREDPFVTLLRDDANRAIRAAIRRDGTD